METAAGLNGRVGAEEPAAPCLLNPSSLVVHQPTSLRRPHKGSTYQVGNVQGTGESNLASWTVEVQLPDLRSPLTVSGDGPPLIFQPGYITNRGVPDDWHLFLVER